MLNFIKNKHVILKTLYISLLYSQSVLAGNTFTAELFIKDNNKKAGTEGFFHNIDELFDQTLTDKIEKQFNGFDVKSEETSIFIGLDVRGIDVLVRYPSGTSEIEFSVPELNFFKTFDGIPDGAPPIPNEELTRTKSQEEFDKFLRENENNILSRILRLAVSKTPLDPVAGNPNSLMAEMVSADFFGNSGIGMQRSDKAEPDELKEVKNSVFVGLNGSRFTIDGHDHDILSLPIAYTYYFENPQYQLRLSMPITVMKVNNSKAYRGSFGAAFRIPLSRDWSLTPAVRLGAIGSEDLGSSSLMYSATLTSNYNFYWNDYRFSIGNMVGLLKTGDLDAGDYQVSYGLNNGVLKNGIAVDTPSSFKLFGRPTTWQASLAHTKFTGDDLFIDQYTEFALSFGHKEKLISKIWDDWRLGFTYTRGEHDYNSIMLNFGYKF